MRRLFIRKRVLLTATIILICIVGLTVYFTKSNDFKVRSAVVQYEVDDSETNLFKLCNLIFASDFVEYKLKYYPILFSMPIDDSIKVVPQDEVAEWLPYSKRDFMLIDYVFTYFDLGELSMFREVFTHKYTNFETLASLELFIYQNDYSELNKDRVLVLMDVLEDVYIEIGDQDYFEKIRNYNMRIYIANSLGDMVLSKELTEERDCVKEQIENRPGV